jgi:OPA family glycerol-3-phosphate transporter-like MFS transporter/OPA family sugar phosphate sensor protein UhpC-like MFS transporter
MDNNESIFQGPVTEQIKKQFQKTQFKVIFVTWAAYAFFYIIRKNLSMAMPAMEADLGVTKVQLGIFLTMHGLIYGVSRFANGFIVHKFTARSFMACGLILCAICNFIFGASSAVIALGTVWVLNGWFQGMGYPPMARLLPYWIPPKELATKMSIWNTSHSFGAMVTVLLCGWLITDFSWRYAFYVPAILAVCAAIWMWCNIKDTPKSVGLPELKSGTTEKEDTTSKEYKDFIMKMVFKNKWVWIMAIGNFFVYILRFAILDWGPTLLHEWKGMSLLGAGASVACFEIAGILGVISAGYVTDKFFQNKGLRVCVLCMIFASVFMFMFWSSHTMFACLASLILAGFCIYGPQALVGIMSANVATRRASAQANGFCGLWGYASVIVTGWGVGSLTQNYGWTVSFACLIGAGIIGAIVFALAWGAKATGYDE